MRWREDDNRSWITGHLREVAVVTVPVPPVPGYLVGLDLGQAQDYTALVIAERHGLPQPQDLPRAGTWGRPDTAPQNPPPTTYHVRHLERFPLGTSYPTIVSHVQTLLQTPPLHSQSSLVVDATGCGRPVVDLLTQAQLDPIAVTITGGDQVTHDGRHYRVPKRDLVGALQVLLQTQRLKVAEALPLAQVLVQELLNFRVTIDPRTAHDSYSAWREGQHDDLVLATALACWWGERYQPVRMW